jgi:type II secretion system protein G
MKRPEARYLARGMTLVEIMVVIVILAILATITVVGVNAMRSRAARQATENTIRKLALAFESYRDATGKYPDASSKESVYASLEAAKLTNDFSAVAEGRSGGEVMPGGSGRYFCDYWRQALLFTVPGTNSAPAPDIWSKGPDGQDDGGADDDIANWDMK